MSGGSSGRLAPKKTRQFSRNARRETGHRDGTRAVPWVSLVLCRDSAHTHDGHAQAKEKARSGTVRSVGPGRSDKESGSPRQSIDSRVSVSTVRFPACDLDCGAFERTRARSVAFQMTRVVSRRTLQASNCRCL